MDKRIKIIEYINSHSWGNDFFKYLENHGIDFNANMNRYLICRMDWGANPLDSDWQKWVTRAAKFANWYDNQNFED